MRMTGKKAAHTAFAMLGALSIVITPYVAVAGVDDKIDGAWMRPTMCRTQGIGLRMLQKMLGTLIAQMMQLILPKTLRIALTT